MHHCVVFVSGSLPDNLQQPYGILQLSGIGMYKNGAVMVLLRNIKIAAGHILQLKLLFLGGHLVPLGILPVGGMDLSQHLHG